MVRDQVKFQRRDQKLLDFESGTASDEEIHRAIVSLATRIDDLRKKAATKTDMSKEKSIITLMFAKMEELIKLEKEREKVRKFLSDIAGEQGKDMFWYIVDQAITMLQSSYGGPSPFPSPEAEAALRQTKTGEA
jgi:hypothetical protein